MFTAKLSFAISAKSEREAIDAAISLLGVWYKNGQILEFDWPLAQSDAELHAFVTIPTADALRASANNSYASQALADLGSVAPTLELLGKIPTTRELVRASRLRPLFSSRPTFRNYLRYVASTASLRCRFFVCRTFMTTSTSASFSGPPTIAHATRFR